MKGTIHGDSRSFWENCRSERAEEQRGGANLGRRTLVSKRKTGHAGRSSTRNGAQHALDKEKPTAGQKNETALPDRPPVLHHV
jgi:hypothetical protein